jgi:hypothetical protein
MYGYYVSHVNSLLYALCTVVVSHTRLVYISFGLAEVQQVGLQVGHIGAAPCARLLVLKHCWLLPR